MSISNAINICPNNDLTDVYFATFLAATQPTLSLSPDKCAIIDTDPETCVTKYEQPWLGPDYYNPLNLPADHPGTEPLSDRPGDSFSEFGDNPKTLRLFPGYSSVITGAPYVATAGGAGGGGSHTAVSTSKAAIDGDTASPTVTSGSVVKTAGTTATSSVDLAAATTTRASSGTSLAWDRLFTLGLFAFHIVFYIS